MSTNAVNLGVGNASGMFYHAPAGTKLPEYPTEKLAEVWNEVGYVSEDGITWHHGRSATPLKDWSQTIRRQIQEDPTGTVAVPVISTTEEVLKTLFGADNVTAEAADATHGKVIGVEIEEGVMSGEEAFLFLMKDGDDVMMLGTSNGFITALDDITFDPTSPITWNATVSGSKWIFKKDDGQKTA